MQGDTITDIEKAIQKIEYNTYHRADYRLAEWEHYDMNRKWNRPELECHYDRVLEDAKRRGFTADELASPYLDKLPHQTHSIRIMRMISLAYYLGKLKGIAYG